MTLSVGCREKQPQHFTFCSEIPRSDFWFGDLVCFHWNDENSGLPYSETGEVVGIAWNFFDKQWEYIVVWLSSTAYPADDYPVFDENFVPAGVLCNL